jgi:hypothetical protein
VHQKLKDSCPLIALDSNAPKSLFAFEPLLGSAATSALLHVCSRAQNGNVFGIGKLAPRGQ